MCRLLTEFSVVVIKGKAYNCPINIEYTTAFRKTSPCVAVGEGPPDFSSSSGPSPGTGRGPPVPHPGRRDIFRPSGGRLAGPVSLVRTREGSDTGSRTDYRFPGDTVMGVKGAGGRKEWRS